MARVPESELERLKREISVERLAESRGVKLEKRGADLHGLCPFHDDKNPSLVISPKKNLWNCLGACQAGGSVIDWVMKAEGVSFRHAVELLRDGMPVPAGEPAPVGGSGGVARRPPARTRRRKLPPPVSLDADDRALLRQVMGYYHETLLASPEALAYLASRGIGGEEAIKTFQLGFANRTLGLRLPRGETKAGRAMRGRLQALGVIRKSGHEHFNGSLVIPVVDLAGDIVEVYGRKITRTLRKGTPDHLYLPGPHAGVWNLSALAASQEVIVCESLLDALTFWCAGFRNVTAAYGVNGFTAEHHEALLADGTSADGTSTGRIERVLIAYDRDEAGDRGAAQLAERLMSSGIECWRVQFPRGMDANEYALKVTPAPESLGLLVRKAQWMGKGLSPSGAPTEKATKKEEAASPAAARTVSPVSESLSSEPPPPEPPPELMSASPVPPAPQAPTIAAEVHEHEVVLTVGPRLSQPRRYRVRGLSKNLSYELLKINLLAGRGEAFHVDTLDLYQARQRAAFIKAASSELGVEPSVIKQDLGKVLLKLEALQEQQIREALTPQENATVSLSKEEESEALALLRAPDLVERILADYTVCGVVGEETNKLTGYLAAVSRKLDEPLAVIVQSSSAAGKSSLMDAVLSFVPEEERVSYSAMTGQSLFYMGETNLKHKVLAVAEEEGAERASYALKLLQSEGELTIASTGKDPATGRLVTHEYRVEGPVAIFLTTTAIDIDEELVNRCLVLAVDEGRAQTRAIHQRQRENRTLEGLLSKEKRKAVLRVHRNAQRLLRPLRVLNPFAPELRFLDTQTRTRRDHAKYLTLIDTIALLHQCQREVKEVAGPDGERIRYIEATPEDVALANRLAHEVLGRSLDELPPQTRRLLVLLDRMVVAVCEREGVSRSDFFFSRRQVRESTGWSYEQLRVHLSRLVDLEYLLVHQGQRGRSYVYELIFDGDAAGEVPHLAGLIDVEALGKRRPTTESLGVDDRELGGGSVGFGVPNRAHTGGLPGSLVSAEPIAESTTSPQNGSSSSKNAHLAGQKTPSSYPDARRSLAARGA